MTPAISANDLDGTAIFLSASIPDPTRWDGEFNALEITDAVVAVARAILMRGGCIVTAAHPTIAPLLLYVASEQESAAQPGVLIYQSAVFDTILPEATRRFEAEGIGVIVRTAIVNDEPADPARAPQSLELMRRQMLTDAAPIAAVFVGGMDGIPREHALFRELRHSAPTYALGRPGGAARLLVDESPPGLVADLADADIYPSISRRIVHDLVGQYRDGFSAE